MSVTTDAFAQGDNRLVNHKTYYFMVLAYGYNDYDDPYDANAWHGTRRSVQSFTKSSRRILCDRIQVYRTAPTPSRVERFSLRHTVQALR